MTTTHLTFVLSLLTCLATTGLAQTHLSFDQAMQLMHQGNRSLKIADKGIEIAQSEREKLNARWYPSLQSSGAFVHLSQNPLPDGQLISSILDQIGIHALVFPLALRNLTTVDLSAEWILFAGGKRLIASRIGQTMITLARESRAQVSATQQTLLVESYYGLRLAQQVVEARQESSKALQRHYENALKLEAVGLLDRAGQLLAQVNRDEAQRELQAALKEEAVMQKNLQTLLNRPTEERIIPASPLFINDSLPLKEEFATAVGSANYSLHQLQLQEQLAGQQLRIDQSGYLPNIALFGKQTLYAHGIVANLIPRTVIGVGFTWNLFDGMEREKRIRQSKLTRQTLVLGQEKARQELAVMIDKLYAQLQQSQDNVHALHSTIRLSQELVRIRRSSFTEGMATSTEVIDAETMLAKVKVAQLAAYYAYDVALMNLLALCGTPEQFTHYHTTNPPNQP